MLDARPMFVLEVFFEERMGEKPSDFENEATSDLKVVALQLRVLHGDVSDMKLVLRDLTSAITKLALIEERQTEAGRALERAFSTMQKIDDRLASLEKKQPMVDQKTQWIDRAAWGAFGLLAMLLLQRLGISL